MAVIAGEPAEASIPKSRQWLHLEFLQINAGTFATTL